MNNTAQGAILRAARSSNEQMKTDLAFVRSVLPDTYVVTDAAEAYGIRCVSRTGIRQDGDAEDDEQWGYTMAAFRHHFGQRLLEVFHATNFCHTDFTIYLA